MDNELKNFKRVERDEYRSRFSFNGEKTKKAKKEKTKTDYLVRLILLQCILCAVVAGGVLLVSKISPSASEKMRSDYDRIMSHTMGDSLVSGNSGNKEDLLPDSEIKEVTAKITVDSKQTVQSFDDSVAVGKIIGGGEDIGTEQAAKGTTFAAYTVSAPVTVPVENARLTSPFGYRTNPVSGNYGFHTGIDLAAPEGTPVAAAFSGKVTDSGENDVWGKYVLLEHSDGFETYYCHLSDIYAPEGTVLRGGETLGLVGSTGWSTGPHLHFEVRIDGIRVDPEPLVFSDEN